MRTHKFILIGGLLAMVLQPAAMVSVVKAEALVAVAPATRPAVAVNTYFPTETGTTWKYKVSSTINDKAEKSFVQTVIIHKPMLVNGQQLIAMESDLVQVKTDGVFIAATIDGEKVTVIAEPQKILCAKPRAGEAWNATARNDSAYLSCLGSQTITTEAGEYTAQVVIISVNDGNQQQETYRYFAKNIGLIRETIKQRTKNADGTFNRIDRTRDLMSFTSPNPQGQIDARNLSFQLKPSRRLAYACIDFSALDDTAISPGKSDEGHFSAGRKLATNGEHAAAIVEYNKALAESPKPDVAAEIRAYKAICHLASNQIAQANAEVAEAMKLNAKSPTVWEVAGQIKISQNQVDAGKKDFAKAAELSPKSAGNIYMDLAAALASKNDTKLTGDIDAALKTAAKSDPPNVEALFQLGQSYANSGDQQGKAFLKKYLEESAKIPEAQRDAQKMQLAKQMIRALDIVQQVK